MGMNALLARAVAVISSTPVMVQNERITLYFYGLWMGSAYCLAMLAALFHLVHHFDTQTVQEYLWVMTQYVFPGAVLGARLCSWFLEDNLKVSKLFRSGFWWHGGLVGTLLGMSIGCAFHEVHVVPILDGFGLAIPAFEIFNRLGCLSYGCCWGRAVHASHPHAIRFDNPRSCIHRKNSNVKDEWLYPVQVYAVILSFLQLLILWPLVWTIRQRGVLLFLGMTSSSVVRLVCEKYRGDFRGNGVISTKIFCVGQVLIAVLYYAFSQGGYNDLPSIDGTVTLAISSLMQLVLVNKLRFGLVFVSAMLAYGSEWSQTTMTSVPAK